MMWKNALNIFSENTDTLKRPDLLEVLITFFETIPLCAVLLVAKEEYVSIHTRKPIQSYSASMRRHPQGGPKWGTRSWQVLRECAQSELFCVMMMAIARKPVSVAHYRLPRVCSKRFCCCCEAVMSRGYERVVEELTTIGNLVIVTEWGEGSQPNCMLVLVPKVWSFRYCNPKERNRRWEREGPSLLAANLKIGSIAMARLSRVVALGCIIMRNVGDECHRRKQKSMWKSSLVRACWIPYFPR